MRSPERLNPEDQDNLWGLRAQVDSALGKPNPAQAKILVSQHNHSLEEAIFDTMFSDENRLKRHLMRLQTELYPNNPYSAPLACASQVNYAKESIMVEAKAALFENQYDQFRFAILFDIADGMGLVANSVVVAEDNLRNPSGTMLANLVDYHAERSGLNPVQNAEVFLRSKQLVSYYAELLKKDNSGLLLIKEVVKSLKDYKSSKKKGINIPMPNHQIPEFLVAGAELGAKLYKKLYPLTGQTTPPKSS